MADTEDQQQHTVENNKEAAVSMEIDSAPAEGEKASNPKAEGNGVEAGNGLGAKIITEVRKKRGRKPRRDRLLTEANKVTEPSTPVSERPAREKKSVDRFIASIVSEKVRGLVIEKGHGTPLKDIPNVAYKLSKRSRADDIVKILHSVLYGKRVKALHVKNNILQFSGFVWGENKDRGKVKEKLEKLHKDSLANLCDVLDLHCSKTANKKEELITKLIEFLEAPHITSDILHGEKEQELKPKNRKRGRKRTPGRTPVKSSRKKRKMISGSSKEEEGRTGEVEEYEDQSERENEHEEDKDEAIEEEPAKESAGGKNEEKEEDYGAKRGSKKTAKRGPKRRLNKGRVVNKEDETEGKSRAKALKSPSKGIAEKTRRVKSEENVGKNENEREDRQTPRKGLKSTTKGAESTTKGAETTKSEEHLVKEEREMYDDRSPVRKFQSPSTGTTTHVRENECDTKIAVSGAQDSPSNISRKNRKERNDADKPWAATGNEPSKKQANETGGGKHQGPTDEEMQSAIAEFLNEVDFNTATLSDIVNRLGERFDSDFTKRKADVKAMIQEELAKLIEEEEEEEN